MKLKHIIAALLAAASVNAMAADQKVHIYVTPPTSADNHFNGLALANDGLLSGGKDVITFTGLAAGFYQVDVSISGQNLTFLPTSNFNGVAGDLSSAGKGRYAFFSAGSSSSFVLNLMGTAKAGATYSGDVTVTAVPEAETYAMMLGGLGLLGFMARRRKAKNAA
jgi:hypothetical protein